MMIMTQMETSMVTTMNKTKTKAVGPNLVNGDRWAGQMATASAWHRCDKDAEVAGLCLLAYWDQSEALNALLTDLTFQTQMLGTGHM